MSEQRMEILDLLAQGKISASEAAEMLGAIKRGAAATDASEASASDTDSTEKASHVNVRIVKDDDNDGESAESVAIEEEFTPAKEKSDGGRKRLRIHVFDKVGNKDRVKISVPFGLLKFGLSIGERFSPEVKGWDWRNLDVDIDDEDERVRIYVE